MKKKSSRITNIKDEICLVALKLFSEKGYDGTNMSTVSDILGITRTPLYYYYEDKKNLYIAAIKKHLATKREIYTDMAAEESDIFEWLHKHIRYACSNTSDAVLFNAFARDEFKTLSDLNDETCRYIYSLKKRRVERAINTGELLADTDIDLFLINIYTMSYGLIHVINNSILSEIAEDKVDSLIDLMVDQIRREFGTEDAADLKIAK
jgi:TetR/AcrR family transcriptional repressor of nem operon